ncbi:thioredoxin family protein [Sulfurimonas sp. C5]|uniref:thioredoxin family protein n=1 Tax=Sulfurimonas sp. C5 TaxID=3036947 RepID=UPI002453A02F|nr:thioredoxin family protein [Sulfurimonas sp. C5]MDH4944016.1 thioredoxin family protein [Sulfurimonas sp. C5]
MKLFLILLLLLSLNATAAEQMLQESKYKYVEMSIGKGKPFFLEVGAESCHSCVIMGKMLYKVTKKHPEYNIHFINVQKERDAAYELKVRMIPTQIIFDKNGKEVYRHIGVLGTEELNKLFQTYSF